MLTLSSYLKVDCLFVGNWYLILITYHSLLNLTYHSIFIRNLSIIWAHHLTVNHRLQAFGTVRLYFFCLLLYHSLPSSYQLLHNLPVSIKESFTSRTIRRLQLERLKRDFQKIEELNHTLIRSSSSLNHTLIRSSLFHVIILMIRKSKTLKRWCLKVAGLIF